MQDAKFHLLGSEFTGRGHKVQLHFTAISITPEMPKDKAILYMTVPCKEHQKHPRILLDDGIHLCIVPFWCDKMQVSSDKSYNLPI